MKQQNGLTIQAAARIQNQEAALLASTLSVIDDQVAIYDRDQRFVYVNKMAEVMMGMKAKEVVGRTPREAGLPEETVNHLDGILTGVFVSGRSLQGETVRIIKGEERNFAYHVTPIKTHGRISAAVTVTRDVTEEARMRDGVRQREQLMRDLIDNEFAFVGLMTPDGTLIEANRAALEAAGLDVSEVVNKPFWETYWWSYSPTSQQRLKQAVAQAAAGKRVRYDVSVRVREGAFIDIDFAIAPIKDRWGKVHFLVPSAVVITDRKAMEREHEQTIALLNAVLDNAPVGFAFFDTQLRFRRINRRLAEINGLPVEEHLGKPIGEVVPVVAQKVRPHIERVMKTGKPVLNVELRDEAVQHPDKQHYWLESYYPVTLQSGHIVGVGAMVTDITQERHVQEALKRSENKFRQLANTMPQIIWTATADGTVDYYNKQYGHYTGIKDEVGWEWKRVVHPDDQQRVMKGWRHAITAGKAYEITFRMKRRDGAYRWFLGRGIPLKNPKGEVKRWFGTMTDIHDQKIAQEKLKEQTELIRMAHDAIIIKDLNRRIISWNKGAEEIYGYSHKEAVGRRAFELLQTKFPVRYDKLREELFITGRWEGELRQRTKRGKQLVLQSRWVLLESQSGKPARILEINRDITHHRELEQRKDEFIGIASHELKTPLTSVKAYIQLLERTIQKTDNKPAKKYLERANAYVDRLNRLISDLLDVSRIQAGRMQFREETFNLSALLREVVESLQPVADHHAINLPEYGDIWVKGDQNRLEQVFSNLVTNAIKYSPQADRVDLRVTAAPKTVTVVIQDYGIGISVEDQKHIFQRFYRGEETAKNIAGLGVSLYISSIIVRRHGGTIWCTSEVGKGTTLYVKLPRVREAG